MKRLLWTVLFTFAIIVTGCAMNEEERDGEIIHTGTFEGS